MQNPKPLLTPLHFHPEYGTVHHDGGYTSPEGTYSPADSMIAWRDSYRGANRIHKPMVLLFWTDVCNGKRDQWPVIPLPNDLGHWAGMLGDLTSRAKGEQS